MTAHGPFTLNGKPSGVRYLVPGQQGNFWNLTIAVFNTGMIQLTSDAVATLRDEPDNPMFVDDASIDLTADEAFELGQALIKAAARADRGPAEGRLF